MLRHEGEAIGRLAASVDDAYDKYIAPSPQSQSAAETAQQINCPNCDSTNVDRSSGYRGEYRCLDCGYYWQVGGWQAT